jgi:hypothetical protein
VGRQSPDVQRAVAGFLDEERAQSNVPRRSPASQRPTASAKGNGAAVLAFGSLFNFSLHPDSLPAVRTRVFESVERRVAWDVPSTDPTDRYADHLGFAQEVQNRISAAGVPIRDMIDVQSILWVLSQPAGDQVKKSRSSGLRGRGRRVGR